MASSTRTLGRGRVLGAGKPPGPSPSPAAPSSSSAVPSHVRHESAELLSPSVSSLSLSSQVSTSRSSDDNSNDISTAIAQQARDTAAAAAASPRLQCPICSEGMVTLLQLNRHLDDAHKDIEQEEQDEVKTWFKSQVVKAKKFQPLAVLNQKIKGLDVFEANEESRPLAAPQQQPPRHHSPSRASPSPEPARPTNPDELVTRAHWQRSTKDGLCSDPMCGKRLGGSAGNIHCRKCGKPFCEEHTMYQMRLSRSAQHDPVRGDWLRVCETCYISRPGYNDHAGAARDHTSLFAAVRRRAVDAAYLDVSRLEKRLSKLAALLASPAVQQEQQSGRMSGYFRAVTGGHNQQRAAEQSVVDWQDDASVDSCPFCQLEFNYTLRRHHCRTCGRVVCADPYTECSLDVPLNANINASDSPGISPSISPLPTTDPTDPENPAPSAIPISVRMCKDCRHTVFSKSDFSRALATPSPDEKAFANLKQFEEGIVALLPRFQRLLSTLQDPARPPSQATLADAAKVRKRLTAAFTQYSAAAHRLRDLPTSSPTRAALQRSVYAQAQTFLHIHMLPLKQLPKMLPRAGDALLPNGKSLRAGDALLPNGKSLRAGDALLPNGKSAGTGSPGSSTPTSPMPADSSRGRGKTGKGAGKEKEANGYMQHAGAGSPAVTFTPPTPTAAAAGAGPVAELEAREAELRSALAVLEEQRFLVGDMLQGAQRRRKVEESEALARNVRDLDGEIDGIKGEIKEVEKQIRKVYTR